MIRVRRFEWVVAIRDSDLPATAKLVAFALYTRMDKEDQCWPSLPTIAKDSGLGRSTVASRLKELEKARWIERVTGGGRRATGKYASTKYLASFPGQQSSSRTDNSGEQSSSCDSTVQEMGVNSPAAGPEVDLEVDLERDNSGGANAASLISKEQEQAIRQELNTFDDESIKIALEEIEEELQKGNRVSDPVALARHIAECRERDISPKKPLSPAEQGRGPIPPYVPDTTTISDDERNLGIDQARYWKEALGA